MIAAENGRLRARMTASLLTTSSVCWWTAQGYVADALEKHTSQGATTTSIIAARIRAYLSLLRAEAVLRPDPR